MRRSKLGNGNGEGAPDGGHSPGDNSNSNGNTNDDPDARPSQAPVFTPPGGLFAQDVEVTLSAAMPETRIFYTLDGTDPTTASTEYAGPFTVAGDDTITEVRAIALEPGATQSDIVTVRFEIDYDAAGLIVTTDAPTGPGSLAAVLADAPSGATIRFERDFDIGAEASALTTPGSWFETRRACLLRPDLARRSRSPMRPLPAT